MHTIFTYLHTFLLILYT